MAAPDLTTYRAVHAAIRHGARALADTTATLDRADRRRVAAVVRYWRGYAGEVLAHHTVEDDIFFPALVARAPEAGALMARTDADHHRLDELMEAGGAGFAALAEGRPAEGLSAVLDELADLMDRHLDLEDREILPGFVARFTAAEYEHMEDAARKALGVGRQAAFSVPFIVSHMDPADRDRLWETAPLPLRVLHRLTRRGHERLTRAAFGPTETEPTLRTKEAA